MRRISTFTTVGAVLATFGAQPIASTAANAPPTRAHAAHKTVRHKKHVAAHRKKVKHSSKRHRRVHVTAESRHLRKLVSTHTGCLTSVDPMSQHLLMLRSGLDGRRRGQKATAKVLKLSVQREQLLEQIALLELRGQTGVACSAQSTSNTLGPATRLTATAPWLRHGSV